MPSDALLNPVSIIIPTYNRSWGLKVAIESVLAQTFRDFELIVVDDCSSDDTVEVVKSFGDSRIKFHRQEQNVGMVANWGTGLRLAKGEFISFLMDDDQLRPDFLASRLRRLTADRNVVAVFSQYDVRDRNGILINVHNQDKREERHLKATELLVAALSRQWFIGAALYRKDAVLEVWEAVSQDDLVLDFGLNIQLALKKTAVGVYIPKNDFVMTVHPGQNSQAKAAQVFDQTSALLARLLRQRMNPPQRSLIKREMAQWHVVWGRSLAAEGKMKSARNHFLKAVSIAPSLMWPWKQLGLSCLSPARFLRSSAAK